MSIRTKIFLTYFFPGFILTFGTLVFLYIFSYQNVKSELTDRLTTVAKEKAYHITTYLDLMKKRIADLSYDSKIQNCAFDINYQNSGGCDTHELSFNLSNKLNAIDDLAELFVLNKDGMLIASTFKENIGLMKNTDSYYLYGKIQPYIEDISVAGSNTEPYFSISAPIVRNSEFQGVIVARLKPSYLYTILSERSGLGQTGEVYLVNKNNLIISPVRYKENIAFSQPLATSNTKDCFLDYDTYGSDVTTLMNHHEEVLKFENYSGVATLGTHSYIPQLKWCILTEITESEAYMPTNQLFMLYAVIGIGVIALMSVIFYWFGTEITRAFLSSKKS